MDFNLGSMQQKMMDRYFRKVDNVVWDLMTGGIGVIVKDEGIATINGTGDDAQVEINMMDQFGIALPAFAQNTAVADVKVGDLIIKGQKILGWITKLPAAKKKSFTVLKLDGMTGNFVPPKVTMLGFGDSNGVMVLRSLINTLPGGKLGDMQNMIMPMLAMGGGMEEMEDILPMLLFSQMGMGSGTDGAAGGMGNMMQAMMPMMMMKMMGGKGKKGKKGAGPFNNLIGGSGNYFDGEDDD